MPVQIERSWTDILNDIISRLQEIIRSEFQLAKTELREEASKAGRSFALLGVGAAIGLYAGGFLLLTLVYALENVLAPWLSALIVAVIAGVAAAACVSAGRKRLKQVNAVPQTISSVRENAEWVKHQVK